jgi:hypothetical protein
MEQTKYKQSKIYNYEAEQQYYDEAREALDRYGARPMMDYFRALRDGREEPPVEAFKIPADRFLKILNDALMDYWMLKIELQTLNNQAGLDGEE